RPRSGARRSSTLRRTAPRRPAAGSGARGSKRSPDGRVSSAPPRGWCAVGRRRTDLGRRQGGLGRWHAGFLQGRPLEWSAFLHIWERSLVSIEEGRVPTVPAGRAEAPFVLALDLGSSS